MTAGSQDPIRITQQNKLKNVQQLNFLCKFVIQIQIYTLHGYPIHS